MPKKGKSKTSPTTVRLAVAQRGHKIFNIWYAWSYKLRTELILPSDPALFHVALLEADPNVKTYVLEAPSMVAHMHDEVVRTRFDATVTFRNGSKSWDEVKWDLPTPDSDRPNQIRAQSQLAAENGVEHRIFTAEILARQATRIWNALRMLQVLHAAEDFSVAMGRTSILNRLLAGPSSIGELRQVEKQDEGLNLAALFGLVVEGAISCDIDSAPLSDRTIVSLMGE